jgi:hypothetical protein
LTIGAPGLPSASKRQAAATLRSNELALAVQRTRVQSCSALVDDLERTVRELEGRGWGNTPAEKASRDAFREALMVVDREMKERARQKLATLRENFETNPDASQSEGDDHVDVDPFNIAFG